MLPVVCNILCRISPEAIYAFTSSSYSIQYFSHFSCSICDVVANPLDWSLNPVNCNDGNNCTYTDVCAKRDYAHPISGTNNVCGGTAYSCPRAPDEIALALMTCSNSSQCDGNGGCFIVPKPRGTLCLNVTDVDLCMPISWCNGYQAQCPAVTRTVPVITPGLVSLAAINGSADVTDAPNRYPLQPALLPVADLGSPYLDVLPLRGVGWGVTCGWIEYASGFYVSDPTDSQCNVTRAILRSRPPIGYSNKSSTLQLLTLDDPDNPVVDGSLLRVVMRGRNTDGISLDSCTDLIVVDSTRPNAGSVRNVHPDLPKAPEPAYHYGMSLAFTALGFSEDQPASTWSSLLKVEYMVAAYPLDSSLPSYWAFAPTMVGFSRSVVTPIVPDATRYQVFVRGYNRAGLASAWAQAADVTIDRSGPVANGSVRDGGYVNTQTAPLTLDWEGVFSDLQSGIGYYEIGWGTARGGDDIVTHFRVEANVTSYTYPFSWSWKNGVRYFGFVRAFSGSGANVTVVTAGQKIDTSPPVNVVITDPSMTRYDQLTLKYTYQEAESVFQSVNITVSTLPSGVKGDVFAGSFTGGAYIASASFPLNYSNLTHRQKVSACITLQNAAQLWSQIVCKSIFIDRQLPTVPAVYAMGPSQVDRSYAAPGTSGRKWKIAWKGCSNDLSSITRYELQITTNGVNGTSLWAPYQPGPDPSPGPGALEVYPWTPWGLNLYAEVSGLPMMPGWSYWPSVRCYTGTGLVNSTTGASQVVDYTPPVPVALAIGTNPYSSQRWTSSSTSITASFIVRDPESQLRALSYAIGTCGAYARLEDNVKPYSSLYVNYNNTVTATGLALSNGVDYCVTIKVQNVVADLLPSTFTSPPIRVDLSPPVQLDVVRDGYAVSRYHDVDYASDQYLVSGSWAGSFDDFQSGIASYAWCGGFSPGRCDLFNQFRSTLSSVLRETVIGGYSDKLFRTSSVVSSISHPFRPYRRTSATVLCNTAGSPTLTVRT